MIRKGQLGIYRKFQVDTGNDKKVIDEKVQGGTNCPPPPARIGLKKIKTRSGAERSECLMFGVTKIHHSAQTGGYTSTKYLHNTYLLDRMRFLTRSLRYKGVGQGNSLSHFLKLKKHNKKVVIFTQNFFIQVFIFQKMAYVKVRRRKGRF